MIRKAAALALAVVIQLIFIGCAPKSGLIKPERPDAALLGAEGVKLWNDAQRGDLWSMWRLAVDSYNGDGVPIDKRASLYWGLKAAEAGSPEGMNVVGIVFEDDDCPLGQDYARAMELFIKAYSLGFSGSANNIGTMYEFGRSVDIDHKEAARWYRIAAEAGIDVAQNNLGSLYDRGLGVGKDEKEAARWYLKAAAQGQPVAMSNLAYLYENGRGVEKSFVFAYYYYSRAAKRGHEEAGKAMESVRPKAALELLRLCGCAEDSEAGLEEGIKKFQRNKGLAEDGELTPALFSLLLTENKLKLQEKMKKSLEE